jgi:hypothetical protein
LQVFKGFDCTKKTNDIVQLLWQTQGMGNFKEISLSYDLIENGRHLDRYV